MSCWRPWRYWASGWYLLARERSRARAAARQAHVPADDPSQLSADWLASLADTNALIERIGRDLAPPIPPYAPDRSISVPLGPSGGPRPEPRLPDPGRIPRPPSGRGGGSPMPPPYAPDHSIIIRVD